MSMQYVLASGNKGKLREISAMLQPLGIRVRPQSEWQVPEAVEDACTFVENALIKARHAAEITGLPTIADDSGLVVPALNGAPGIYSARFAGPDASDQANILRLLQKLEGQSGEDRAAHFYCAMVSVLTADDPAPLVATGRWFGYILDAPQGEGGFGYDPVFGIGGNGPAGLAGSAAELTREEKSGVSHRGKALKELVRQLSQRDGRG